MKTAILFICVFTSSLVYAQKGYSGHAETGVLHCFYGGNAYTKSTAYNQNFFTFKTAHGYTWKDSRLFIGAGVGADITAYSKKKYMILPLFVEVKGTFMKTKVSPYLSQQVGYSLILNPGKPYTGAISETAMGMRIKIAKRASFNISAGYRLQHTYGVVLPNSKKRNDVNSDGSIFDPTKPTNEYLYDKMIHLFYHMVVVKVGFTF